MDLRDQKQIFYEFGSYVLDSENKILLRGEELVSLSPKLFETLSYFVENSGKTLFKEEILNNIWSETFVEESNLAQIIFHLRKTLGSSENTKEFIKTMPKRGYRFVAPVKKIYAEQAQNNTKSQLQKVGDNNQEEITNDKKILTNRRPLFGIFGLRGIFLLVLIVAVIGLISIYYFWQRNKITSLPNNSNGKKSLAVLSFKQFNGETDDKQMSLGMADALTTKLGNLNKIRVSPTGTVIKANKTEPIEIGKELGVETVLTGIIQQDNDRIRVTVQLIDVNNGSTIWADKFDTSAKNIFEVQDNISEQVSRSLINQLNDAENLRIFKRYTNNLEAYEAYSRGRYFWASSSRTDLRKAIEYFEKAIKLDPQYALAYSGLADSHIFLASNYAGTPTAIKNQKLAKINALKALQLDDSLAEPHTTLAAILFEESGDWDETEKEFLKSIELNPNYSIAHNWYSLHLLSRGDFEKAESEMKKALEIDPISPSINGALGQIFYFKKDYTSAINQFTKTLELDSRFTRASIYLALSLAEIGKKEEALKILEPISENQPQSSGINTALGWLYATIGNRENAQKKLDLIEKIEEPNIYEKYAIALINTHLGNTEKGMAILNEISNTRNINLIVRFKFDPKLNVLRQDKNFVNLVKN